MNPRVLLAYIAQVLIWGTTWAAIKVGVSEVPAWVFAFDRSVLVAGALAAVALAFGLRFPRDRRTLIAAAASGAVNSGVSWAIIFWAEQFVPSGLVAVFGATGPIWTAVLAHFLVHGDRLSRLKVAAITIGFAGVAVLVGTSGEIVGGPALLATGLLALMPLGWAAAGVVMSRALTTVSPVPAIAIGSATGGVFLIPFALHDLARPATWTPEAAAALVYLALVGSGVGLVLNLWLYRRLRPTTIMLSQLLITVEAVLVGAVALGEALTPGMILGAALVLSAIALNAGAGGTQAGRSTVPEPAAASPAD